MPSTKILEAKQQAVKDLAEKLRNAQAGVLVNYQGISVEADTALRREFRAAGVSCVIAKTFARIFYRNAINIGLAILECEAASDGIADGDEVAVDFDTGIITNVTKGETYQAEPFPPFIRDMIAKGGLMASVKE